MCVCVCVYRQKITKETFKYFINFDCFCIYYLWRITQGLAKLVELGNWRKKNFPSFLCRAYNNYIYVYFSAKEKKYISLVPVHDKNVRDEKKGVYVKRDEPFSSFTPAVHTTIIISFHSRI